MITRRQIHKDHKNTTKTKFAVILFKRVGNAPRVCKRQSIGVQIPMNTNQLILNPYAARWARGLTSNDRPSINKLLNRRCSEAHTTQ
jgi:hypothetical protein